jgi:uncharacterized membrane protein YeaQ/YmgE (transglycosylase-associated protein family)
MEFLWFILIGLAAGWLAGQLMRCGGFGVIGDIIVGVIDGVFVWYEGYRGPAVAFTAALTMALVIPVAENKTSVVVGCVMFQA